MTTPADTATYARRSGNSRDYCTDCQRAIYARVTRSDDSHRYDVTPRAAIASWVRVTRYGPIDLLCTRHYDLRRATS